MNLRTPCVAAFLAFACICGCAAQREISRDGGAVDSGRYRTPEKYNFRFIGYDDGIDNPENDRRSYYRIYIDKAEEGRTTIGLESQEKVFETTLAPNRHLVTIEKWVLDQKSGRYIKLNNIEQPKPNYIYFDLPENRIVIVEKRTGAKGEAEYRVDYERE